MGITANQRETLQVDDVVTDLPFDVLGDSATGAVYVNIRNASLPTTVVGPTTATITTVGDTTSSTTLLALSATRKEAEFYNNSTAILYLLKGSGTASSSNYTVQMQQGDYYTTSYSGQVNGVWASDAGGSVLITSSS